MKRIKHSILILLTLLSISKAVGQNYPVQSFVQISQPYSSYLPDYADPFNNQLKILLTLTDFTVPSHQVKIKIHLNGNGYSIETKDNLNLPPIILTPGAPVEISGSDLAPYLATENLNFSGIDVNNYLQTKVLPEGPCQICVDIIDFTSPSGILLGNPACAQAWFERLQPPFANTPFCGDTISTNNPQVVLFNWTPVTSNSPSTFTTEYVFELYENTAGIEIDPNVLVTTTLPVSIITTPNAFINFGMTDYQLQVGKQYVWRVQARNTEGRDLYVNNGYSAVCSFVYGSLIESLTNGIELELQTNGTGTRQGNAIWNANSVFDNYVLEVRKTGNSDFEWFPYTTEFGVPISNMKINGLEPETEYEARIKGLIGNEFESDYSNVSVFTTNPTPNYQCGSEAMPATSPNITPLQVATYGMFFTIGQFEMMVTHIEPLVGQAGHYKGLGQITMPFLLTKLNVSYQDILVDDNLMVREGKVEAITQGIDAWEHDQLIDLATPHYTPEVDTSLITMAVDSSGILVTFTGVDSTFEFEGNGIPIVLNAEGGIQYIIWPDGSIELGTWGNVSTEDFDATKDYYVNFEAAPNQAYGFDDYNSDFSTWAGNYENIFLSDNTNYYVSYKSTAWNIGDHVLAKLHTDSTALDLTFTIDGDELDANHVNKINDSTYNLNLDGYMETYSENVYAFDSYGRKIGKLRVIPYENKNIQVYIVPVGSAQINQPNLEAELNNIYKVANTHFDVTIEPTFNNTAWDLNNDGKIEVTDPQLLATYSGEMRKLRQQYFDSSNVERDKEALYIFVVDQFDNPNQDGYMVKGKSFGFVKNNPSVKTIAHEIGHGAFKLEHTFPTITQNTTNNLLDYSSGTELLKPQWEQIFNTQITFSFLDDAEDGGMLTVNILSDLAPFKNTDTSYTFLTPLGNEITLPGNQVKSLTFSTLDRVLNQMFSQQKSAPIGTLIGFTSINGTEYYYSNLNIGIGNLSEGYYNVESVKESISINSNQSNSNGKHIKVFLGYDHSDVGLCYYAGLFSENDFSQNTKLKINLNRFGNYVTKKINQEEIIELSYVDELKTLEPNLIKIGINKSQVKFSENEVLNTKIINHLFTINEDISFDGYLYYLFLYNLDELDQELISDCGLNIHPWQFTKLEEKFNEIDGNMNGVSFDALNNAVNLNDSFFLDEVEVEDQLRRINFLLYKKKIDALTYKRNIVNSMESEQWSAEQIFYYFKLHGFNECTFSSTNPEAKLYVFQKLLSDNDLWYSNASYLEYDGKFILTELVDNFYDEENINDLFTLVKMNNYSMIKILWEDASSNLYNGVGRKDIYKFLDRLAYKIISSHENAEEELFTTLSTIQKGEHKYLAYFESKLIYHSNANGKYIYAAKLLQWYAGKNRLALTDEEEDVTLSLFESITTSNAPEDYASFISYLINNSNAENSNFYDELIHKNLFHFYYHHINGDEFKNFVNSFYNIWQVAIGSNQSNYGSPVFMTIKSEQNYWFYSDNFYADQSGYQDSINLGYDGGNSLGSVHLFQPIINMNIDEFVEGEINLPDGKMIPAFYLLAFDDLTDNHNIKLAAEIVVDIASIVIPAGVIFKAIRGTLKLATTFEKIKLGLTAIELTAGILSASLKYSTKNCSDGGTLCEGLRNVLFWIEMATLTNDALISRIIKKNTIKSAKNLKNSNNFNNADEAIKTMTWEIIFTGFKEQFKTNHKNIFKWLEGYDDITDASVLGKIEETFQSLTSNQINRINLALKKGTGEEIYTELGEFIAKLCDGHVSVLTKLTNSTKWTITKTRKLANDLANAPPFKTKLLQNPNLVDSWKVLSDAGETNLVNRLDDIEFVDDFIRNNPNKTKAQVTSDINTQGYNAWKLAEGVDDLFSNFTHLKNLPTDAKTFLSAKNWDNALLTKLDGDLANTTLKNAIDVNPNLIDSWKKLDDLNVSPAFRRNLDNLNQRSVLDEYAGNISTASNARKGNFGEIGADLDLNAKGYESLQPRITGIDESGHNGLDGVYRKNGQYYIVEGKYTGSASLNPANPNTGLPRQMSDDWIATRNWDEINLDQSIIDNLIDTKNYQRILAKVAPDGSVTYKLVDADGYIVTGNAGIFNP